MEEPRKIYTLSDLAKSLRSVIERNYSSSYWVKAEIAKLNHYPRSGHCYPDLVEKLGDQVMAQMRAIMWASDFKAANQQFIEVTGEPLREGMAILFQTSVTFHPVHGLSLLIHQVEPTFTLGQMAHEKQKTLERLKQEGIFDKNKALPMPLLPRKLAVISVETSKGYHDFLKIIQGYSEQYGIWHHLFPALLQGEKAVEGITGQLRRIRKAAALFDMVAIIRGGGGDVGLNAYDHYTLAREIALFPIPVITGIGHATNETVAEMVAWQNKITPTDVAYFVLGRFTDFDHRVQKARDLIALSARSLISQQEVHLIRQASLLGSFSVKAIEKEHRSLQHLGQMLRSSSHRLLDSQQRDLTHLQGKIKLLNPEEILRRGYSVTSINGQSLKSTRNLKPGDRISTRLFNGSLQSIIESKQPSYE
jgi:exodeoxyribonuclease VII large subunit